MTSQVVFVYLHWISEKTRLNGCSPAPPWATVPLCSILEVHFPDVMEKLFVRQVAVRGVEAVPPRGCGRQPARGTRMGSAQPAAQLWSRRGRLSARGRRGRPPGGGDRGVGGAERVRRPRPWPASARVRGERSPSGEAGSGRLPGRLDAGASPGRGAGAAGPDR